MQTNNSNMQGDHNASYNVSGYHFWCIMQPSAIQTWKKPQAVQAAFADILSEITLFWGLFELIFLFFWLRMEEEELNIEKWGLIKEICGRRMGNEDLELEIGDGGQWIEDRPSWVEDFLLQHQHLIHIHLFIHCRKSR